MKNLSHRPALLLSIAILNICLIHTSCAQEPKPTCCDILALEEQIDEIDMINQKIAADINLTYYRVWEARPKPSMESSFNSYCNSQSTKKPLINLSEKKEELIDIRKNLLDKQYALIKRKNKCTTNTPAPAETEGDNVIEREEPEDPSPGGRTGSGRLEVGDSEEESEDDYIKDPIAYDPKKPFDVLTDVEFGKKGQESKFNCVIYDPKSTEFLIDFLYQEKIVDQATKKERYSRIGSFDKAVSYQNRNKRETFMLMNAGIFDPEFKPLGLFIRNKAKYKDFNNKKGEGNFYLEPSGVFAIREGNVPVILTKQKLGANLAEIETFKLATQSGPMLVIDGKIHPAFKLGSPNRHIRNGVGILPDGKIVFAISKNDVSFYEFAMLFRDGFKCKDALYLDGTISKMYAPKDQIFELGGEFSGIIAIYKNKK